jgi:hypothetical protein
MFLCTAGNVKCNAEVSGPPRNGINNLTHNYVNNNISLEEYDNVTVVYMTYSRFFHDTVPGVFRPKLCSAASSFSSCDNDSIENSTNLRTGAPNNSASEWCSYLG